MRELMVGAALSVLWTVVTIGGEPSAHGFAKGWLLLRLDTPLERRIDEARFSLVTERAELDRAIAFHGVHRIERALPVSSSQFVSRLVPYGLDRTYKFFVREGADIRSLVAAFSAVPGVELAEPDLHVIPAGLVIPDDPLFPDQWAFDQPSDADLDGPEAWTISTGGDQVIAVVDSGVDASHEDLQGKVVAGYDFRDEDNDPEDEYGHGTPVSSIAVAVTDNAVLMAGVCWGCRQMPLKIWDDKDVSPGTISLATDAFVWATAAGARILNLSGGYLEESPTFEAAVQLAHDAGVILVSVTHNGNNRNITYPGKYPEVIAVGATDFLDQRAVDMCNGLAAGSNFGPEIDVVAPGDQIVAAKNGGGYGVGCGTSLSAPFVAGLIGIVRSMYPSVGREEAQHLVEAGAEDEVGRPEEDTPGFDIYHGWGRINMDRTLQATRSTTSLRVEGAAATAVRYEVANPLATSFDFIRGDLGSLSETVQGVALGATICLENDSPNADTIGAEDRETPQPGEGFFYVARFNAAPGPGSYGGSTKNRDRFPSSAGCAD